MHLHDLWRAVAGPAAEPVFGPESEADQAIADFVVDSRLAAPGTVFVALPGERTDGHLYLKEALARGAVAALAGPQALEQDLPAILVNSEGAVLRRPAGEATGQRTPIIFVASDPLAALQSAAAAWRSQMPASVVAVTGSVGKTTTKEMIASVLAMQFNTLRSQGNLNNEIGLPLTLLQLNRDHERAVLEMGMYDIGEIARLCQIARPRIGIVTNVGPTHLERLGTVERIAQAKTELVQALPAADQGGVAILNYDDPRVLPMQEMTQARIITYGLDPAADLWADEIVSEGLEGIGFLLHMGQKQWHVRLDVLGRHSVHTALRAAAVGFIEGMPAGEIIAGMRAERGNLRLMVVSGLRGATIIDDTYNASPVSMLAALHLLEDVANADHRAIAVLGDMLELGAYEEEGHRVVGGRAAETTDKLVVVGTRARWIADAALAAGMPISDVYPVTGNEDAIAVLQGLIRTGDVILVKGSRGQHMEDIVDTLSRMREP